MERFGSVEILRTSRGAITKRTMTAIMAQTPLSVVRDGVVLHDREVPKDLLIAHHQVFNLFGSTSHGEMLTGTVFGALYELFHKDFADAKSERARELFLEELRCRRYQPVQGRISDYMVDMDQVNEDLDDLESLFRELFCGKET